jgi:hypothetical protein
LVIDEDLDLVFYASKEQWNKRKEKEVSFEEFVNTSSKKTLYNNHAYVSEKDGLRMFSEKYVKEALKEFLKSIAFRKNPSYMKDHIEDAKEIFGKGLVEWK